MLALVLALGVPFRRIRRVLPGPAEPDPPEFFLVNPLTAEGWLEQTAMDGARVQEIIDGVHRSSAQGRWIDTSGTRWPVSRGF